MIKPEIHQLNERQVILLERKDSYQDFIKIVLIKWDNGEYSTHLQNLQYESFCIVNGHYYCELSAALIDFQKRS